MIDGFSDEVLAASRTTRPNDDPLRDGGREVVPGDLLLVPTTPYRGRETVEWATYERCAHGSAAVYPYKVRTEDGIPVQVRASEVAAWARPVALHRTLVELRSVSERAAGGVSG